jgi:hypothetical protein
MHPGPEVSPLAGFDPRHRGVLGLAQNIGRMSFGPGFFTSKPLKHNVGITYHESPLNVKFRTAN